VRIGSRLMQSESTLALVSQRCVPAKFLEANFPFQFSQLRAALENLCWR
jgi:NAD dependent epimerase/dehydratase family enzyme